MKTPLQPAAKVISICGGFAATASLLGYQEVSIRKWTYTSDKGGTGGTVPYKAAARLLDKAKEHKLKLRPEHFFPPRKNAA